MSGTLATEHSESPPTVARHAAPSGGVGRITWRSIGHGAIAAAAMASFYVVVVRGASGSWSHLTDQARQDWYYLAAIVAGFGIQVALVSELRGRRRLGHSAAIVGSTGAGASTAGMIACCAHHIADLLPVVGAASAAGFLTDYRVPFMLAGIAINTLAVVAAGRSLRRFSAIPREVAR